ncbi:MAG: tetratricopeptide repeat protein [bacterium]
MNVKKIIYLILGLFISLIPVKASLQDSIEVGNKLYSEGKFNEAIITYEEVLDAGFEAAELYYNLGNAYFKLNDLPRALVNYERAYLLKPNDEEIQNNRNLASTYVVDELEEVPVLYIQELYLNIISIFSSNTWTITSIIFFMIFLFSFFLFLFSNNILAKKIFFILGIIVFIFSITSYLFARERYKQVYENRGAIVLSPSVTVKSAPGVLGKDLYILHEGTKVKAIKSDKEWVEIKLPNGSTGWLKSSDIIKIAKENS